MWDSVDPAVRSVDARPDPRGGGRVAEGSRPGLGGLQLPRARGFSACASAGQRRPGARTAESTAGVGPRRLREQVGCALAGAGGDALPACLRPPVAVEGTGAERESRVPG